MWVYTARPRYEGILVKYFSKIYPYKPRRNILRISEKTRLPIFFECVARQNFAK